MCHEKAILILDTVCIYQQGDTWFSSWGEELEVVTSGTMVAPHSFTSQAAATRCGLHIKCILRFWLCSQSGLRAVGVGKLQIVMLVAPAPAHTDLSSDA